MRTTSFSSPMRRLECSRIARNNRHLPLADPVSRRRRTVATQFQLPPQLPGGRRDAAFLDLEPADAASARYWAIAAAQRQAVVHREPSNSGSAICPIAREVGAARAERL